MNLAKTSLLNGAAVAIKIACGVILNKILAVYVGPSGYAVIGQFQNAVSLLTSLAGGLLAQGVTKVTAENFDDEAKQHKVWQTAIVFSLAAALVAGVVLLGTREWISLWLLRRPDMSSLFVWLAVFLPAMAANNLLLAIINGKKEIGVYVVANIAGSVISIIVAGVLTYSFGLYGALLAFTINPAIVLMSTALMATRCQWFKARFLLGKIDTPSLRSLSGFAIMGMTSAIAVPITYIVVRDYLASHLGLPAAGYWQATSVISGIFVMMATSTLSVYYLPRLAEIRTATEMKTEIIKVYRFVMPIVIMGALVIYSLRDFIIRTLFTEDFYAMRELFAWQLIGDVLKIGSWILGYILVGRAMVKVFVASEILFAFFFIGLSWYFVDSIGLVGVSLAYAISYAVYWIVMIYVTKIEITAMDNYAGT